MRLNHVIVVYKLVSYKPQESFRSDLSVFDQRCNVFCRSYNGEPAYSLRGAEVVLLYNMLRAAIMRG